MTKEEILNKHRIVGYYDQICAAMQEYADQEVEKARDELWESEYGTGDNKGTPMTPEETKKFWDELPKKMLEKYSDENFGEVIKQLYK